MIAYSIDSFRAANGRCFGWGWFLDSDGPAHAWSLHIRMADGSTTEVPGTRGGDRTDVAAEFPHVAHATAVGFLLHGHLQGAIDETHPALLRVELENGTRHEVEVPASMLVSPPAPEGWAGRLRDLSERARHHRRQHGLLGLVRRLWQRAIGRVALEWLQAGPLPAGITFVFDHDLGGGANAFRTKLLGGFRRTRLCLLVTPILDRVAYRVRVAFGPLAGDVFVADLEPIARILQRASAPELHVNELVSFPDPASVISAVVRARQRNRGRLTFYLHDFHAVCPSWTLLDREDRFCGVPDLAVCAGCLAVNHANTLGFVPPGSDVASWRRTWGTLLQASDEIRAFSRASASILQRAYPELDPSTIRIEGHATRRLPAVEPHRAAPDEPITIAVAGHISIAKGARIIARMAERIVREDLPVRIVVFGTLGVAVPGPAVHVHGSYRGDELPGLLRQYGVSTGFLPSICAETFSYVTDEFMSMRMPFACFPIGAPAERLAQYPRGLVVDSIDPEAALDQILDFVRSGRAFAPIPN